MTVIKSLWARNCSRQFITDMIIEAFSLSAEEADSVISGTVPELAH